MNESTVLPRIHARALPVLKRGGLFTVVLQRVLKLHVCLAKIAQLHGYRYKKTAVVNERYALNSLLTL